MNRRTVLAALAAASTGLGGCVGDDGDPSGGDGEETEDAASLGGDGEDDHPEDETPHDDGDGEETTDAPTEPGSVSNSDFLRTDRCEEPGGASVEFSDGAITVEGCVVGRNGCEEAALAAADYEGDAFVVTVETVEEGDATADGGTGGGETESDGEFCTQALTHLGYAFRADFDGAAPRAVRVIHDDANGREAVAVAERDA